MEIELYSVKGFKGNLLKSRLETALTIHNVPFCIKENHNVDDFIKLGLTSVPALKIGSQVIECTEDSPFDETVQKAIAILESGVEPYILVPVDFTTESIHALRYARMIASHLNMGITVTFIHEPLMDEVTSSYEADLLERNRERLDQMLIETGWDKIRDGSHIPIETHLKTGGISTQLIELSNDDKYELIIMSTKAEDTFLKRVLGSLSTNLSRSISKPVIVVPPDAAIKFPDKWVVGLTEELIEKETLNYILDFASEHCVFVDFVYVTQDLEEFKHMKNRLYEKLVLHKNELCGFNIRSLSFSEKSVDESLSAYAAQERADMLIMVTKHRNFIERLSHRSISKKALLHPVIPIMILHKS